MTSQRDIFAGSTPAEGELGCGQSAARSRVAGGSPASGNLPGRCRAGRTRSDSRANTGPGGPAGSTRPLLEP